MTKFYRQCEHCHKDIVHTLPNGQKSYGHYKPLCDECEEDHRTAQGYFCPGCGTPVEVEGYRCLRCVGIRFDADVAQGSVRKIL